MFVRGESCRQRDGALYKIKVVYLHGKQCSKGIVALLPGLDEAVAVVNGRRKSVEWGFWGVCKVR